MVPLHIASFSSLVFSVSHTPQGQPTWSSWTPWSVCSASCSPARRHRHRFCASPPNREPFSLVLLTTVAAPATVCPGPEAEEEPCLLPGCNRKCPFKLMLVLKPWVGPSLGYLILVPAASSNLKPFYIPSSAAVSEAGGWSPWSPWSGCSRSCGGGLRSRTRACGQPPPQGLGDFCEGPQAQGEACQAQPCPGTCRGWGGPRNKE